MVKVTEENVGLFIHGALDAPQAMALAERMETELGVGPTESGRHVVNALVAMKLGVTPRTVARHLDWKDFEKFCSLLFRSRGYDVRENITLRKPRAQIDLLAVGPSYAICVDCKRWRKDHSASVLRRFASAQKRRSGLLRKALPSQKPIVSAILSLSATAGDFVEGVAIVPIGTLSSFLDSLDGYLDRLETS
jgi:hypothetical protein